MRTRLWCIPLQTLAPPTTNHKINQPQCNNAYQTNNIADLITFLHATAFSPTPSSWIQAIQKGFFQSWPGLTTKAVRKHLPKSMTTNKGNLD
jgi:hypothetical protein